MHGNFTRENRETPLPSAASKVADRWEKAMSYKTHMHGGGESYSGIVPAKQSNEGRGGPKEIVEGRPLTKENMEEPNPYRTQSRESGPSGLDRVRQAAKGDKKLRFTALLHHVNVELLRSSYYSLKKQAAAGVDGVTWQEYGDGLEERLADLHGRIHRGAYQAQTVTKSLDTESRWKATAIGNRGAGRQSRPARGGEGSQPDLGRGLSGFFVWVPAGAQPARCAGRAVRRNHAARR